MNVDDEWDQFLSTGTMMETSLKTMTEMPEPSPIYISTKSNIGYLNQSIDIHQLFWEMPVMPYWVQREGIVKKQIKFVSTNPVEWQQVQDRLKDMGHVEQHVMTHIENPTGRIKFKDIRKISVGVCRKDILSYHSKKRSAFYNCIVFMVRLYWEGTYRELHVKVFNTGKLEVPGIQQDEMYLAVIDLLIRHLKPILPSIEAQEKYETILINSNFTLGYYIHREVLYALLQDKYRLECIYDPCSYPGIQCKFYYNPHQVYDEVNLETDGKNTEENTNCLSFMIFRTGSVLIVGKGDCVILNHIYKYLLALMKEEFHQVAQEVSVVVKQRVAKIRKKTLLVFA